MQYVKATLLAKSKEVRDDGTIVEIVVWELPKPVPPCVHHFKYRLFYGLPGQERVRYDNERGKGDHRHVVQRFDRSAGHDQRVALNAIFT